MGVEEVVAARGRRATERGDGRKRAPDQILVHVHGSGVENVVAIEMLAEHINSILMQRELQQEALNLASKKLLPQ